MPTRNEQGNNSTGLFSGSCSYKADKGICKLGYKGMMWAGVAALLLCLLIGSINTQFIHYWLTMVILGIGWNFPFSERYKPVALWPPET